MIKGCFRKVSLGDLNVLVVMIFMSLAISRGGLWLLGGLLVMAEAMILMLVRKGLMPPLIPFFSPLLHLAGAIPCVVFGSITLGNTILAVILTGALLLAIEIYQAIKNGNRESVYFPNVLDTILDLLFGAAGIWLALKLIA